MGSRGRGKNKQRNDPKAPTAPAESASATSASRVLLDEKLRLLKRAYTGVSGAKVFLLAILTLLPLAVPIKWAFFSLDISVATAIYAIYHGLGIFVWLAVRQMTSQPADYSDAELQNECDSLHKLHVWLIRPLSIFVIALIGLTFLAKASWVWGDRSEKLPLPSIVYKILGVRQACETSSKAQQERINAAVQLSSEPCQKIDTARFEPVRTFQECQAVRQRGKICIVAHDVASFTEDLEPLWAEQWTELYANANPGLMNARRNAAEIVQKRAKNQLVLVQAPAGFGKSWVVIGGLPGYERQSRVQGTKFFLLQEDPRLLLRVVDLRKVYSDTKTPDLVLHGQVINSLYGAIESDPKTLMRALLNDTAEHHDEILVLDSLDEIHPAIRDELLSEVYKYVDTDSGRSVFILGRPEAMPKRPGDYVSATRVSIVHEQVRAPEYVTSEAVAVRWNNAVLHRLRTSSMRPDKNASITHVISLMKSSPTICASFGHLVVGNWIIMRGDEWKNSDGVTSEVQIQSALFDELMRRNEDTHNRPMVRESQYQGLLEEFALNHLTYIRGDSFRISPYNLRLGGEDEGWPRATEVLHHSGLIDIDPVDTGLYRFQPSWVASELVRRADLRRCSD